MNNYTKKYNDTSKPYVENIASKKMITDNVNKKYSIVNKDGHNMPNTSTVKGNQESKNSDNSNNDNNNSSGKPPSIIDRMIKQKTNTTKEVIDFETMIQNTRIRVWKALKEGYEYADGGYSSDKYLRKNVHTIVNMTVLYVDVVGSTKIALEMPPESIATIMSSFAQEMALVVNQYNGYVLKFVGDAVIGYFVSDAYQIMVVDNAVNCARSMLSIIQHGINPILDQYDYPELKVRIGLDIGQSVIVRYGSDPQQSHVDLLGPVMNIAAKIQNRAPPNHILIGSDVYDKLHPDTKTKCKLMDWSRDEWSYRSRVTGKIYEVYNVLPISESN